MVVLGLKKMLPLLVLNAQHTVTAVESPLDDTHR